MVLADLLVCGFSALRAEKPPTIEKESTALPKAQHANCVSPIYFDACDQHANGRNTVIGARDRKKAAMVHRAPIAAEHTATTSASAPVAAQTKTTTWCERTRGRGILSIYS